MKNLLGSGDLSKSSAIQMLDLADQIQQIKEVGGKSISPVGLTVANLFYEDSTRTRISFELAEKALSTNIINFSVNGSSVSKGEGLIDTARTLQAMGADAIVIRHPSSGAAKILADSDWVSASVINAGDGTHEHPTQALLDAFTIRKRMFGSESTGKDLQGIKVLIVGDIAHSRVARSNLVLLKTLGAKVYLVGPPTLLPSQGFESASETHYSLDDALEIVEPDVIMVLRIQKERMSGFFIPSEREYSMLWGLSSERLSRLSESVLIMHPGPMNRGLEIDSLTADANHSTVLEQVANGVTVRIAVLQTLLSTDGKNVGF